MSIVFEKKELAEFLLKIILEIPDLTVTKSKTQYNLKNLYGRSVRLDIIATDSNGKIYNIEVQRDDRFANPERARLNSSLIDANFSKKARANELCRRHMLFSSPKMTFSEIISRSTALIGELREAIDYSATERI